MISRIGRRMTQWAGCQRAATTVEYGLLIGLLALTILTAISAVGSPTERHFNAVENGWPDR